MKALPLPRPASVRQALRRLARDTSGLALIEFAYVAPLFAAIGVAGMELSHLAQAHLRVNDIAVKVADNTARVRGSIDETDIKDIFAGAKEMGEKIQFAQNGRIIVSSIEPVMAGTPSAVVNQHLRWQRCTGAHAANSTHGTEGQGTSTTSRDKIDGYGIPGKMKIFAAQNTAVVLVEVVYTYRPLISNRLFGPREIKVQQSMVVRNRGDQVMRNAQNLTNAQRMLCSNTHTA